MDFKTPNEEVAQTQPNIAEAALVSCCHSLSAAAWKMQHAKLPLGPNSNPAQFPRLLNYKE